MNAAIRTLLLAVLTGFACWMMAHVVKLTDEVRADEHSVAAPLATASEFLNAPCTDNGHQVVCGTLAQIGQTTKNTGILAAQGAEQVKQSGALIAATTRNMDAIGAGVTGEIASLKGVTDSVPPLTAAATKLLGTANETVEAGQPVLEAATRVIDHTDAVVTGPDVTNGIHNAGVVVLNAADITADAEHVAHKFAYPPSTPWYKKGTKIVLQTGTLVYDFIR